MMMMIIAVEIMFMMSGMAMAMTVMVVINIGGHVGNGGGDDGACHSKWIGREINPIIREERIDLRHE